MRGSQRGRPSQQQLVCEEEGVFVCGWDGGGGASLARKSYRILHNPPSQETMVEAARWIRGGREGKLVGLGVVLAEVVLVVVVG